MTPYHKKYDYVYFFIQYSGFEVERGTIKRGIAKTKVVIQGGGNISLGFDLIFIALPTVDRLAIRHA